VKRHTIQRIIVFAVIAVVGVIATQIYLIDSAITLEKKELTRQVKQDSLNRLDFNDRVKTALSSVAKNILTVNNDPAEIYKAVEQLRPNYFVVRINDTLHPGWLEQMLRREFDRNNIDEDYRYGIYDCFTDSIVYQNLVVDEEAHSVSVKALETAPQIKWNTDGHYFSVTFPDKENLTSEPISSSMNPWIIMATVAISLILALIAYTLWIILRQKRLSEVKTDFINNMTHELKTPISTISLSSEVLLRKDIQTDQQRITRYAQIIHDENARLQNQVERVLQLAKLDRGEVQLKLTHINLHDKLRIAVEHQSIRVESMNGSISYQASAKNEMIKGDEVHINNIINNLLDNAIKYSADSPNIEISTTDTSAGIEVRVKDHGLGIKKEHLKNIFDKFYRVPTGNLHDVKGFGLGLYYVKELIRQHGGDLKVNSTYGKGSEFIFFIPQQ